MTPLPRRWAVTNGVPSASVAQVRSVNVASGSASTWRLTVTSVGTAMPKNGLSRVKALSCCGCSQDREPPRMRPPRRSFTGTRSSSAAASRGPAKRTSTPPSSIQWVSWSRRLGDVADVGEDQHRQALLDELAHRLRGRAAIGEPHVGERPERAREIIGRGEQRLRGVGGRAGDHADRAPAPALVEQRHRAGRALAGDLEAGDVVADFDRKRELGVGLALAVLEGEGASPSGRPLRSRARTVPVSAPPPLARRTFTVRAPAALSALESARAPAMPPSITVIGRCSTSRESAATKSLPPPRSTLSVSQISSTSGVAPRKRPSAGNASARSTAWGFGLICWIRTLAAAGVSKRNVARRLRQRDERNAAIVRFRARDQVLGGAHAHVPGARRREAVVDQQGERRFGGRGRNRRVPQRPGSRDDDERGERQAQQREPPWGALRRLLLGRDVEQQRVGGKATRRGCGGMSRSSHHSTGRLSSPSSTSGCAKPSGSHAIMPTSPVVRRRSNGRRSSRRGEVRRDAHAAPAATRSPAGRCGGW